MNPVIEREELPTVVINLLTKDRTDLAVQTIHQALRHLKYEGALKWFVTDNGSDPAHHQTVLKTIPSPYFIGTAVNQGTIGQCWNEGLRQVFQHSDYYIRLEDDMRMKDDLDITRYVKLMMTYPEIGMIRLGQMCMDLLMYSEKFRIYTYIGFEEDILFKIKRQSPYAFSGHPALTHRRFHEVYGLYEEDPLSAGELEVIMDERFRKTWHTNYIYFPWDLGRFGTWGAWDHIGLRKAE